MSTSAPLPDNDPRVIAWNAYKATDDFANTRKWALDTDVQNNLRQQYVEGSLWASFIQGFEAGGTAQATPREDELHFYPPGEALLEFSLQRAKEAHLPVPCPTCGKYRTVCPDSYHTVEAQSEAVQPVRHPRQPAVMRDGVERFKENHIVRYLLDAGPFDLNQLAMIPFSQENRQQFAQLIGYSVCGYEELSYVEDGDLTVAHPVGGGTEWRDTFEQMPNDGEPVLVSGGTAVWRDGVWYTGMEEPLFQRPIEWKVTHWMPFPALNRLSADPPENGNG